MSKYSKLLLKILSGTSDVNINFFELSNLLERLGFVKHTRGSHNIFRKDGIEEKINLQKDGSNAKPYQVKQVRNMILNNNLGDADV